MKFQTHRFPATDVRSLCWRGDALIDWVSGGHGFMLDGSIIESSRIFAYRFDSATASPDGRFAVIYERSGTKGLLLDNGNDIREINRSYYCANDYEYPVLLFQNSAGRNLLAHCPDEYCRLEIDDAATGERLTASNSRKCADYFFSRLAVSPSGKRLLSAGWFWHPVSLVMHFKIADALLNPGHLDDLKGCFPRLGYEEGAACWLDDETIAVSGTALDSSLACEEVAHIGEEIGVNALFTYEVNSKTYPKVFELAEPTGTIHPIGLHHILSLYRCPKLIDLRTGKVVHAWSDIDSDIDLDAISAVRGKLCPPMAFDRRRNRFAIASGGEIIVITFHPDQV